MRQRAFLGNLHRAPDQKSLDTKDAKPRRNKYGQDQQDARMLIYIDLFSTSNNHRDTEATERDQKNSGFTPLHPSPLQARGASSQDTSREGTTYIPLLRQEG